MRTIARARRIRSGRASAYSAELLEPRRLLSTLVRGTPAADTIVVNFDATQDQYVVNFNGNVSRISDSVEIDAGDGNDRVTVNSTGADKFVVVFGDNNDDTITVGGGNLLANLQSGVIVNGDAGVDTIVVDDSNNPNLTLPILETNPVLIGSQVYYNHVPLVSMDNTFQTFRYLGGAQEAVAVDYFASMGFATVDIRGGSGNNSLDFNRGDADPLITYDGGSGGGGFVYHSDFKSVPNATVNSNSLQFGTTTVAQWTHTSGVQIDLAGQSTLNVTGVALGSTVGITTAGGTYNVGNDDIDANILGTLILISTGPSIKVVFQDTSGTTADHYDLASPHLSKTGLGTPIDVVGSHQTLTLNANGGSNTINVVPSVGVDAMVVNAGGGNDVITYGAGNIHGSNTSFIGGTGTDTLTFDDSDASDPGVTSKDYSFDSGILRYTENGALQAQFGCGVESVVLDAGGYDSTFTATDPQVSSLVFNAGDGNDTMNYVPFTSSSGLSFNGQAGSDLLDIDDSSDTTLVHQTYTLNKISFTKAGVGSINFGSIEKLTVQGSNAVDVYNIGTTPAGLSTTVQGGTQPDTFNVGNGDLDAGIRGNVTLQGNQGGDTLVFDDTADTGNDTTSFTNGTVTKSSMTASVTYGTIEHVQFDGSAANDTFNFNSPGFALDVTLNGNAGADTFNITPSAKATVTVNGSDPSTSPGDVLRFMNASSAGAASLTLGNPAVNGTYTFASAQPVAFTGIESFPAVPGTPGAPNLLAADDTGISDSDQLTDKRTVTLQGTGPALSTIQFRSGSTTLGTALTTLTGTYSEPITFPADGTFNVIAVAVDAASGLSGAPSPALAITIDTVAPPAPTAAPDLAATSDTGISSTDNITRDNTPTFAGAVPAGTFVRLLVNGADAGLTPASAGGSYALTPTLTDGGKRIAVRFEDAAGNQSAGSPVLDVTIDTTAPLVTASAFNFQTTHALRFNFSEDVGLTFNPLALSLQNVTNATTIPIGSIAGTYVPNTGTFTFPGLSHGLLPDGNYHGVLSAAAVTDIAGNPLAADGIVDFFVLTADVNHDHSVNFPDLLILAQHFGQSGTFAAGDVNFDGAVNFTDLLLLAQNFGRALPAPAAGPFATAVPSMGLPSAAAAEDTSIHSLVRKRKR